MGLRLVKVLEQIVPFLRIISKARAVCRHHIAISCCGSSESWIGTKCVERYVCFLRISWMHRPSQSQSHHAQVSEVLVGPAQILPFTTHILPLPHPQSSFHLPMPPTAPLTCTTHTLRHPHPILPRIHIFPRDLAVPSTQYVLVHTTRRAETTRSEIVRGADEMQLHAAA